MRRAEKIRLLEAIANWGEAETYFEKIVMLALLPAEDITLAFAWLRNEFLGMRATFEPFLNYFEMFWLNNITPQVFSVYRLRDRTNNYIESYQQKLNKMMGPHPTVWQFSGE